MAEETICLIDSCDSVAKSLRISRLQVLVVMCGWLREPYSSLIMSARSLNIGRIFFISLVPALFRGCSMYVFGMYAQRVYARCIADGGCVVSHTVCSL